MLLLKSTLFAGAVLDCQFPTRHHKCHYLDLLLQEDQHISIRTPKPEAFKCEAPAKESTLESGGRVSVDLRE